MRTRSFIDEERIEMDDKQLALLDTGGLPGSIPAKIELTYVDYLVYEQDFVLFA